MFFNCIHSVYLQPGSNACTHLQTYRAPLSPIKGFLLGFSFLSKHERDFVVFISSYKLRTTNTTQNSCIATSKLILIQPIEWKVPFSRDWEWLSCRNFLACFRMAKIPLASLACHWYWITMPLFKSGLIFS